MNLDDDFFTLFGLPRHHQLDRSALDSRYRELSAVVHPDAHAHASDAERRLAMQWSTRLNEGHQTLRNPATRARYLLELDGVDVALERNTAMPPDFLIQQMEWREAIAEARAGDDVDALEGLLARIRKTHQAILTEMAADLDERHDTAAAAGRLRMLKFMERLEEETGRAIEELEDR